MGAGVSVNAKTGTVSGISALFSIVFNSGIIVSNEGRSKFVKIHMYLICLGTFLSNINAEALLKGSQE